jgi:hypothetical protein
MVKQQKLKKKRLIHEVGDWIIKVDQQQTERLTFDQVKELLQSKILERRQINIGELQMTFASITNVFRKFTLTTKDHRLEQNRIQKEVSKRSITGAEKGNSKGEGKT